MVAGPGCNNRLRTHDPRWSSTASSISLFAADDCTSERYSLARPVAYGFFTFGRSNQVDCKRYKAAEMPRAACMTWLQWVAQNQYLLWTMRKSCMRHSGEATFS